jgi:hypothetical protein
MMNSKEKFDFIVSLGDKGFHCTGQPGIDGKSAPN